MDDVTAEYASANSIGRQCVVTVPVREGELMPEVGVEASLTAIVWPTYIGVAIGDPNTAPGGEPFFHQDYERGQITWIAEPDKGIVGRATIKFPPGEYGWFVFFFGPHLDAGKVGATRWEFAEKFTRPTVMDVYPIRYTELVPR